MAYIFTFLATQMKTWSSIGFIIGSILWIVGIGMYMSSSADLPPIPSGWLFALVFLCFGCACMISSIMLGIRYHTLGFFGFAIFVIGVRLITIHPYVLPECTCPPNTYGKDCVECRCVHGSCDEGYDGTGVCYCDVGWAGPICDRCASTFVGENCDICKHGWDGPLCNRCFPGFIGNCDECAPNFVRVDGVDQNGNSYINCAPCQTGWGGYCVPMPECTKYDKLAIARDAKYWKTNKLFDPNTCTSTTVCQDRYDCESFNCRGVCVLGDMTYNRCENDLECEIGSCEYKTCCEEKRYGDGTCECKTPGHFGPLCEKCPGFDGIYDSVCSGHGTCSAVYSGDNYNHLECVCDQGWSGPQCGCFGIKNCTSCADGFYGSTCQPCPGGSGVDQCNGHGVCKDGIDGDGTCVCDQALWSAFAGQACERCYSGAFEGPNCELCKNGEIVGYKTGFEFKNNYIKC